MLQGCLNVEGRSFDADMVKRGLRDPNDPRLVLVDSGLMTIG